MSYCTVTEVKELLPRNITKRIDEELDDTIIYKTLSTTNIEYFIESAGQMVDAAISVIYVTPLVKIIEVNRKTLVETELYPKPISYITALITAYLIFQKAFSEQQAPNQIPKYAEDYKAQAMRHLVDVRTGALDLRGQRKIGWRYLRPESRNVNRLPIDIKEIDPSKM